MVVNRRHFFIHCAKYEITSNIVLLDRVIGSYYGAYPVQLSLDITIKYRELPVRLAWLPNHRLIDQGNFKRLIRVVVLAAFFSQPAQFFTQAQAGEPSGAASSQSPAVVLQLLDPSASQSERDDDFRSDFRRWADILVGDYKIFLPLIAMFVVIGAAGLVFDIRRRRPHPKVRHPAGMSFEPDWRRAARGAVVTRMAMPRNLPGNADHRRSEGGRFPRSRS